MGITPRASELSLGLRGECALTSDPLPRIMSERNLTKTTDLGHCSEEGSGMSGRGGGFSPSRPTVTHTGLQT